MNLPNMRQSYVPLAFVAIILAGCATPQQPIPELSQPQSAGFGIDVTLKLPIGLFSARPEQVFFVKIDDKDGLQREGFRSNYNKDGRAYFLNAPPGTYVAIGAYFSRQIQSYGMPPKTGYTTHFAKELVEDTKVTVRENDFAFMGRYVVDMSVAAGSPTETFLMGYVGDIHYRGTTRERTNDEQARNDFFRNAKDDLAGSAWATRIK